MTGENMINPKREIRNPKQYQSSNDQNPKQMSFGIWNLEFV
jgi:hypothetical protein